MEVGRSKIEELKSIRAERENLKLKAKKWVFPKASPWRLSENEKFDEKSVFICL